MGAVLQLHRSHRVGYIDTAMLPAVFPCVYSGESQTRALQLNQSTDLAPALPGVVAVGTSHVTSWIGLARRGYSIHLSSEKVRSPITIKNKAAIARPAISA